MASCRLSGVLGTNIAKRRAELGLTQLDLAEKLGITVEALGKMERGIIAPKFSRLDDIAMALNCSVASLLVDSCDDSDIESEAYVLKDLLRHCSQTQRELLLRFLWAFTSKVS